MNYSKLFTEIAVLLQAAAMMGQHDQQKLRRTLVEALVADTGMPAEDVETTLLLVSANLPGPELDTQAIVI